MQDRFKFRVWNKLFNIMTYNFMFGNFMQKSLEDYEKKDWVGLNYEPDYICFNNEAIEEDLVIMQCTGLKDKNGKLIYEGDIVYQRRISDCEYLNWEAIGIVKFGIKDFSKTEHGYCVPCFYLEPIKINNKNRSNCRETNIESGILNSKDILDEEMPLKVIGNIYENEELLNGNNT